MYYRKGKLPNSDNVLNQRFLLLKNDNLIFLKMDKVRIIV